MGKNVIQVLEFLSICMAALFFCTTPQNPFSDPGNAKISLVFKDSKGNAGGVLAVSDTVGETVKIGVCPYLSNLIDSVEVTILKYQNNIDSVYVLKNFSSDLDTPWHSLMFSTIGKWDVSAKSIAHGGKLYMLGGSITIHGKNVSATIQPATETRVVDSIAIFTVSSNADTPLTYQWYHDTMALTGETGASFIKSHITFSDSGKYNCFIRDKWGDTGKAGMPGVLTITPKVIILTNTKPLISISGHSTILSTGICSLTVLATDPDSGQVLTLAVVKGPGGYSFAGNLFEWEPPVGYLGADTVKTDTAIFTVVDNGQPPLSDTAKVAIVVTAKIIPPDSVKGVTAVSRINGSFVFSWNKSKNTDQYSIYRSKDTTGFVLFTTTQDTFFANAIKDTAFYYYVVATNSKGSSSPSKLVHSTIINDAPAWSHDAVSIPINEGTSFSFNCADSCKDANGDSVSFQLVTAGSVNDSLVGTIWKFAPSYTDSGVHTVKIKATDGIDSSILTLTVHVVNVPRPPQPQPQNLSTNRNTALVVTLAAIVSVGGDPVTQWLIDTQSTHGTSVLSVNSGAGTVTYTPANAFVGTDYFTFKSISGTLPSTYSAKVTIRVDTNNVAPKISQKLSSKTLNKGDSLVLTITINSDAFPAPWYYWYKDATRLDSTQVNIWKKSNLALADSGYYYVLVKNIAGQDSCGAKLTMQMAPSISSKLPVTTTVNAGSATPISVTVNSDATPSPGFQWYFNGQAIVNATTNSYSKTWAGTDAGTYKVVVSNAASKDSSNTTLIVNLPPTAPTLVSPANGAASQPVSLTLTWNKIAIAASYYFQVASDTAFATIVASDSTLTDTAKTLSSLLNGTTYYWRVRAKNAVGVSPWSAKRSFTIIVAAPAAPMLTLPADKATNVAVNPMLTWNTVTGAASYRVQVSTSNTFGTIYVQDSTLTAGSKAISGLSNSTKYYWRVNATNVGGTGAWATDSFTTIIAAPGVPSLTSPANGATDVALSLTLNWSAATNAATYRLQVATDSTFQTGFAVNDSTLAGPSRAVSALSTSTKYYWRVNAKNAAGTGSWSSVWHFTTVPPPPGQPTLVFPIGDSTDIFVDTILSWIKVSNSSSYNVQISTAKSFSTKVFDFSGIADTFKNVTAMPTISKLFWRANAANAGGSSTWNVDSFITGLKFTPVRNNMTNMAIHVLAADGGTVLAGNSDGIFLSTDSGVSWNAVMYGWGKAIAINGTIAFAATTDGLFRSLNGGLNWQAVNNGLVDSLAINAITIKTELSLSIFVATSDSGVYRSLDTGKTWTVQSANLRSLNVHTLAVSGGYVLAGTDDGVDYSSTNGNSWGNIGGLSGGVTVYSLGVNGNTVYAGINNNGVPGMSYSSDNGKSWSTVNSWPAVTSRYPSAIVFNGSAILAGTNGDGVFASLDNGASWYYANNLTATYVHALAIVGHYLFNGTQVNGVYRSPLP
jgi:hypothetical protein